MLDLKTTYMYKEVNNCKIYLDFYSSNIKKSPVIIIVHDGALIWGSRKYLVSEQIQLYNNAGYSVFAIDYRLAPETKLEYIVEDIRDAIIWIRQKGEGLFDIDTNKIALVGHSAGGYLSLLAGTFVKKPNVIVSFYGYGEIIGKWYSEPSEHYCFMTKVEKKTAENVVQENIANKITVTEGSFPDRFKYYLYCRQNGSWPNKVSGFVNCKDKNKLIPFCPIHNISKDFPPTLLIHGDKDTDVPFEQSLNMAKKLKQFGVVNETIIVKDEGHAFDYDMSKSVVKSVFNEVLKFLNRNM